MDIKFFLKKAFLLSCLGCDVFAVKGDFESQKELMRHFKKQRAEIEKIILKKEILTEEEIDHLLYLLQPKQEPLPSKHEEMKSLSLFSTPQPSPLKAFPRIIDPCAASLEENLNTIQNLTFAYLSSFFAHEGCRPSTLLKQHLAVFFERLSFCRNMIAHHLWQLKTDLASVARPFEKVLLKEDPLGGPAKEDPLILQDPFFEIEKLAACFREWAGRMGQQLFIDCLECPSFSQGGAIFCTLLEHYEKNIRSKDHLKEIPLLIFDFLKHKIFPQQDSAGIRRFSEVTELILSLTHEIQRLGKRNFQVLIPHLKTLSQKKDSDVYAENYHHICLRQTHLANSVPVCFAFMKACHAPTQFHKVFKQEIESHLGSFPASQEDFHLFLQLLEDQASPLISFLNQAKGLTQKNLARPEEQPSLSPPKIISQSLDDPLAQTSAQLDPIQWEETLQSSMDLSLQYPPLHDLSFEASSLLFPNFSRLSQTLKPQEPEENKTPERPRDPIEEEKDFLYQHLYGDRFHKNLGLTAKQFKGTVIVAPPLDTEHSADEEAHGSEKDLSRMITAEFNDASDESELSRPMYGSLPLPTTSPSKTSPSFFSKASEGILRVLSPLGKIMTLPRILSPIGHFSPEISQRSLFCKEKEGPKPPERSHSCGPH